MRYGVFEVAATEASLGVKEIDDQMQQISAQMEQLKSRKTQLEMLARQLQALATEGAMAGAEAASLTASGEAAAETATETLVETAAAEPLKPEMPLPEMQPAEPVLAGSEPMPPGWFSRRNVSGIRNSGIFTRR